MGESSRQRSYLNLVVFVAFLFVALVATWPLIANLGTVLPGPSTDALIHYWSDWYVDKSLAAGHSPFETTLIFHPNGASLAHHNFAWMNILPWLVLERVLDGIVAYNVIVLIYLAIAGYAVYLLTYQLTNRREAAVIAGIIYLAWPFRISQLDHPNLITTHFVPLFFLFLLRLLQDGRRRDMLLAALCLALVAYTRWQVVVPVSVLIVVYLAGTTRTWIRDRRRWGFLFGTAALAILFLLPAIWLLAGEQLASGNTSSDLLRTGEETIMATDLLAYLTPPSGHPLWGEWTSPLYDHFYPDRYWARRFPAYLGWSVIPLLFVALWKQRRRSVAWLLMGASMIALALGATLRINGTLHPDIPTLFKVAEPLYIFRLVRVPDRFNLFLALPVAVLAAYGAATLLRRFDRHGKRAILITCGLSLLVLFDYSQVPVAYQNTKTSPLYEVLAVTPDEGAVLDVPIDTLRAKEYMFAQRVHERPLLFGHISRQPADAFAYIDGHPVLGELRRTSEFPPWQADVSRQLKSLAQNDVGFIVLQKLNVGADRLLHWQRYLAFQPRHEDESIAVYTVTPQAGRDFALQTELAPGLGPIGWIRANDCVTAGQLLSLDVSWGTATDQSQDYVLELQLQDEQGNAVSSPSQPLMPDWPTSEWPANTIAWGYYSWRIPPTLPPGAYDLQLQLLQGQTATDTGRLSLGEVLVASEGCQYAVPETATPLNAVFGEQMRLLGYDLDRPDSRLLLTLYWQAEQHMDQDLKIFVHVFPSDTGVPVAQDDARPHRGGYPTRFWYIGEVVSDRIPVDLSAVPAGTYGIAVGVYDALTLERLPLVVDGHMAVEDGRLVFADETITVQR